MAVDHSSAYRDRWVQADVDAFLERLCPAEQSHLLVAQSVADTLTRAHVHSPASWGLTRKTSYIRVNVGTPEAMVWAPGRHALESSIRDEFPVAPFLAILVDIPELERRGVRRSVNRFLLDYGLSTTPNSFYAAIPTKDPKRFSEVYDLLKDAHFEHLFKVKAKRMPLNPTARGAHHPGLVDAIARRAGCVLEQPSYVKVPRPVGHAPYNPRVKR